LGLVHDTN